MKHLLLSSIIAMLTVPAFADTVTTLPNNAVCNETNLGTSSGAADIEVAWEANTITTQWYTGYGENTAAANATTCTYDGTINLPQTNPSRPGYAFNGWKLRTPTNPLLSLDASIWPTKIAAINPNGNGTVQLYDNDYGFDPVNNETPSMYGVVNNGEWAMLFSGNSGNFKVSGITSCNQSGTQDIPGFQTIIEQYQLGEITEAEAEHALGVLLYTTNSRPYDAFSSSTPSGANCWCRATGYTPNGSSTQNITNSPWVLTTFFGTEAECLSGCAQDCATEGPDFRTALYGQLQ